MGRRRPRCAIPQSVARRLPLSPLGREAGGEGRSHLAERLAGLDPGRSCRRRVGPPPLTPGPRTTLSAESGTPSTQRCKRLRG